MAVATGKAHNMGRGPPELPLKNVPSNRSQIAGPGECNDKRKNNASNVGANQPRATAEQSKLSNTSSTEGKASVSQPVSQKKRIVEKARERQKRDEQDAAGSDKHATLRSANQNRQKRALGRHTSHQRGPVDAEAEAKRREAKLEKMMLRYDARGNITGGRSKSYITNIYEYLPMDVEGPRDIGKEVQAAPESQVKKHKRKKAMRDNARLASAAKPLKIDVAQKQSSSWADEMSEECGPKTHDVVAFPSLNTRHTREDSYPVLQSDSGEENAQNLGAGVRWTTFRTTQSKA